MSNASYASRVGLATDANGHAIPACAPAKSWGIAVGGSSNRMGSALDATSNVVTLIGTVACWVRFGDETVVATKPAVPFSEEDDFYLPGNLPMDFRVPADVTHIACIQNSTSGALYILQRQ